MSTAKKCDRCGKFYERFVERDLNVYKDNYPYPFYKYDLCDECFDCLEKFLDGAAIKADELHKE